MTAARGVAPPEPWPGPERGPARGPASRRRAGVAAALAGQVLAVVAWWSALAVDRLGGRFDPIPGRPDALADYRTSDLAVLVPLGVLAAVAVWRGRAGAAALAGAAAGAWTYATAHTLASVAGGPDGALSAVLMVTGTVLGWACVAVLILPGPPGRRDGDG